MKASDFALSLGLLFALTGAARAQDQGNNQAGGDQGGTLKPTQPVQDPVASPPNTPQSPATTDTPTVQGNTQKDPGGWRGQQPAPDKAQVPESDPLAGKAAPTDPEQEEAERRKNDRVIDRNYDDAMKIYDKALQNDGESVDNLDHRIQTNEKLIADYKVRLARANAQKRQFQIELYNRTFFLKQQKDKGAIPEDTFDKLMKQEEKKYNDKSAQARSDVEFYEKEIADAEKRLNDLRAERRISTVTTATMKSGNPAAKKKPPVKQSVKMVNTLKDRMQQLSAFEPRNTMDGSPLCDQCMQPSPGAAPAAPSEKDTAAAPAQPDQPVQR